MIRGPPASPSFSGCGIPGSMNGILPSIHPRAMPINIGIKLGWFKRFRELPSIFSA